MNFNPSRRSVLTHAGKALAAASAMAIADIAFAAADAPRKSPHDVGRKFQTDGRVRDFIGNTIICHLPQQDAGFETFDALLDVYRELPAHVFSRKLALLPTSSYHMTIFGGANDQERKPGLWPADVPLDAPMQQCDAVIAEKLAGFALDCELPFRMRVNDAAPVPAEGLRIDLAPADEAEEKKLRRLRDRLADCLKIRAPDHDHYAFHISLAYQIDWFDAQEKADFLAARQRWFTDLKQKATIIHLGAPEYCTMRDMFAFRRRSFIT